MKTQTCKDCNQEVEVHEEFMPEENHVEVWSTCGCDKQYEVDVYKFWDEQCAQPLTVDRSELPF